MAQHVQGRRGDVAVLEGHLTPIAVILVQCSLSVESQDKIDFEVGFSCAQSVRSSLKLNEMGGGNLKPGH